MRRVANADGDAFAELYDEFADTVFSIAVAMLRDRGRAEDAAQDVWIKIWNAAGSFDSARASVATWIATITHRHALDLLRRMSVRRGEQPGSEPGDERAAREASELDVAERASDLAYTGEIRVAMRELSDEQRTTIELAYFGGLTHSEIAARMDKPIGTIKTYMFQGMRRLRDALDIDVSDVTPSN